VTMLSGILANRSNLNWYGPRGEPMSANYNGCITQLKERGVHGGVGFAEKVNINASMAAVGGWEIRPSKLGDALRNAQILDYDMVRQLKDEMNRVKVFRGYYDPRFIGSSQHATATHILSKKEAPNCSEALKTIRADIRYFKWRNGVVGHTTVIWSASVEPNCELVYEGKLETAKDLLDAIEMSEEERGGPLSPSLIYATAAILEGCSFVNGGSQNTMCGGLEELARQQMGVYCLGTDFKAGQTKFKTAAVEYIRTMGLTPKVIASSNHLGNNDMRNLATADKARHAKLRVKHDIFAAWEEDIDHKVSVMFTPMINDEKRDFVEYTSLGFLGQHHTMVTYTRASDSVLCVPLMIDAAVWCDFFSTCSWPYEEVSKALAYLFKVPEGAAKGVDPGFFRQMEELKAQVAAACSAKESKKKEGRRRVRIRAEKKNTEWAIPNDKIIVCAGLACVDMQLGNATGGDGGENIEIFEGETSIGGGSVSMACKSLARLCHGAPLDEGYMQVTPPVVHTLIPICKIGHDDTGNKLLSLLENCGRASRNVDTKYAKSGRKNDQTARTALAVLPIFKDGRRGCFFDAASNATFEAKEVVGMLQEVTGEGSSTPPTQPLGAFVFGYPHLLPNLQGEALAHVFSRARASMDEGGIIVMDLNGVPDVAPNWIGGGLRTVPDLKVDRVIGPALGHVDILHMNEDELVLLTGCSLTGSKSDDEFAISNAASLFLLCGVAVVAVTRGQRGCFIACNDEERFAKTKALPSSWVDSTTFIKAVDLPEGTTINTNGAGDSFTAGLLVAAMLRHTGQVVNISEKEIIVEEVESAEAGPEVDEVTDAHRQLTPYNLFMKEHYVSLRAECKDDKKAIFTKCHILWENESKEVKAMYERRCNEELEDLDDDEESVRLDVDIMNLDGTGRPTKESDASEDSHYGFLANRALNLETAAQFACLVAAHHVDVGTRDSDYLDISTLLERAMVVPHGLEEI